MRGLAAEHLLPGEGDDVELVPRHVIGKHRRGRVADRETRAVVGDPAAIGNARTGGGAVPGEDNVIGPVDRREIGNLAIGRVQHIGVQFQLLVHVGDPALTEAFPGEHRDAAGTQEGPHRHFDRARVRARDDADSVRIGHLQHLARQVDRQLQDRLADLGAGLRVGLVTVMYCVSLQRARAALGPRGPPPRLETAGFKSSELRRPPCVNACTGVSARMTHINTDVNLGLDFPPKWVFIVR